MIKSFWGRRQVNGLKMSRVGLAVAILWAMAEAGPTGAATTKHHRAATHHVAKSHAAAGKVGGAKTASRRHSVKGRVHHRTKAAVAEAGPTRRHAALCRTVMVRHKEVEKCR
jgi:hypothetical protein